MNVSYRWGGRLRLVREVQPDQQLVVEAGDAAPCGRGDEAGPEAHRDRLAHPHHPQMLRRDAKLGGEMALPRLAGENVVEARNRRVHALTIRFALSWRNTKRIAIRLQNVLNAAHAGTASTPAAGADQGRV
ncbi:hypothetical protein [Inquilinus sp.]|uniref:hypothetical protein n=1 Tax=Inquilinus sp. TaxID=1932117 RepID=UPI0031D8ED92